MYRQLAHSILLEAASTNMVKLLVGRSAHGNFIRGMRGQFAGSTARTIAKRLAEKARPLKVYVASPLGFPFGPDMKSRHKLLDKIESAVKKAGHKVISPWRHDYGPEISSAYGIADSYKRRRALSKIATKITDINAKDVDRADAVLAVYHPAAHVGGKEIDSGTVAEVSQAVTQRKPVHLFRSAGLPDVGDFEGKIANVQALRGTKKIFRRPKDINF
jgi:nucleoside 2-deoxyribosyltransferase